ncbi:MAG: hypothetical protein H6825_04950 [Planctomycetes bacterium]|nr:hypothetical protein [Planctomycetota bacterium]
MATIYRALVTAVLLVWAYVILTGLAAGSGEEALAWHLRTGLVGSVVACLVHSVPFAYFLGTGFWVKAFVRASGADASWEERQKGWMTESRAYPALYLAPLLTLLVPIAGSALETRAWPWWIHPALVVCAALATLVNLFSVPGVMLRNSALMDELADTHRVPLPDTPEMDAYIEREERHALPPLFQLSRVALLFAFQLVVVWLYLRFGTEGWRGVPFLPFGLGACVLLTLGLGLNALYDPEHPARPGVAWGRAMALGVACLGLVLWIRTL